MSEAATKLKQRYNWNDYRGWPDDERWEIVDGEAYAMSPSPTSRHQMISGELFFQMRRHFKGKQCRLFAAPMDVKLSDEDIVQPDLLVVCDSKQIKPTHIEGPPSLVVEILSHSSTVHDRARKTALYARAGIKEYWIVTPYPSLIEVFALDGSDYRLAGAYPKEGKFASPGFPDLTLNLPGVFDFPLEPGEEIPLVVKEPPAAYGR